MIPNLFILSSSGEVLIEKQWVGTLKRTVTQAFWEELCKQPKKDELAPVFSTAKYYFIHTQRFELYFVSALTFDQSSPLLVLEAQQRIIDVLCDYFSGGIVADRGGAGSVAAGQGTLSELAVRENFSTTLLVLDEMFDAGFPYTTEINQLKDMIAPPSLARRVLQNVTGEFSLSQELPHGTLSKIPWRKTDVQYVTNEVYFDLVEQIDAMISSNGVVNHCCIYGEIRSNCRLTGMPDLTLSFSRPDLLDDASLHRCVRINRYQKEKVISFVPPDGHFTLLSYRVPGNCAFPLFVKPMISYKSGSGRVQISVTPRVSHHSEPRPITGVVILVNLPLCLVSHSLTSSVGNIRVDPKTSVLRWEIGKLPLDSTVLLEGALSLPSDFSGEETPIVRAEFTQKMTTASGLKVDGLLIRGINYKPFKGVRSITQAGKFQVRAD